MHIRPIALALACLSLAIVRADDAEWEFAPGSPAETLAAAPGLMPEARERVRLPHRLLLPNRSLWYRRTLDVPEGGALEVSADDGAQVFIGGRRARRVRRWFFVPEHAGGRAEVIVRVLNNAMEGGLRSVRSVAAGEVPGLAPDPPRDARIGPVESAAFRRAMPPADRPCSFTAWADSQNGWDTFARLARRMADEGADFSVGVGDLVNEGADAAAWSGFLRAIDPLAGATRVVPVAGNHDYDGFYDDLRSRAYERLFRGGRGQTWFAWSCGPARFVAVDLNREFPIGIAPGSDQHAWLAREARSRAWRGAAWRVLLVHQPPFSRSWPGYDGDLAVRRIVETLAGAGLRIVLSGHSHAYEHLTRAVAGRAVEVFIVGGAGGALEVPFTSDAAPDRVEVRHHYARVRVTREAFTLEAVGLDGAAFDRAEVGR